MIVVAETSVVLNLWFLELEVRFWMAPSLRTNILRIAGDTKILLLSDYFHSLHQRLYLRPSRSSAVQ